MCVVNWLGIGMKNLITNPHYFWSILFNLEFTLVMLFLISPERPMYCCNNTNKAILKYKNVPAIPSAGISTKSVMIHD